MAKITKKAQVLKDLFEEMAEAKISIKTKEEKYKEMEKKAWDLLKVKSYEHPMGKFTKNIREYYGVYDKCALVKEMTFKVYKEHSTISKSGIVKAIGEKGFDKMKEQGVVGVNSTAEFFVFKQKKTPVVSA